MNPPPPPSTSPLPSLPSLQRKFKEVVRQDVEGLLSASERKLEEEIRYISSVKSPPWGGEGVHGGGGGETRFAARDKSGGKEGNARDASYASCACMWCRADAGRGGGPQACVSLDGRPLLRPDLGLTGLTACLPPRPRPSPLAARRRGGAPHHASVRPPGGGQAADGRREGAGPGAREGDREDGAHLRQRGKLNVGFAFRACMLIYIWMTCVH